MLLKENNTPYFGLHGTYDVWFNSMISDKCARMDVMTVYEKNYGSEESMVRLYSGAYHVLGDDARRTPERIMIFNVEKDGKNMADKLERLPRGHFNPIGDDTAKERMIYTDPKNAASRSFVILQDRDFDDRYAGAIDVGGNDLITSRFDSRSIEKIVMKNRFISQQILAQAVLMLGKK
jgi:hypothetical protein